MSGNSGTEGVWFRPLRPEPEQDAEGHPLEHAADAGDPATPSVPPADTVTRARGSRREQ